MSSVPTITERERRFDWINAFMTASLNALIESSSLHLNGLDFATLNESYVTDVIKRLESIQSFPNVYVNQEDLDYFFHLEAEIWGPDYLNYEGFFEQTGPVSQRCCLLQTHLLADAFFLLERWLHIFIPHANRTSGRPAKRRFLFGKDVGTLTVRHKDCLGALGPPYNLLATTTTVTPIQSQVSPSVQWSQLHDADVPMMLARFYHSVSGHTHFVDVIEASFKSSRRKLPRHVLGRHRDRRSRSRGSKATWYDVLWTYSESIRYHPIWPSPASRRQPFYWNRSVRWCTSLLISGLLCIIRNANPVCDIGSPWHRAVQTLPQLKDAFDSSREAIMQ